MADGYDPPVPVNVALPACHLLAVDKLPQGPGRLGAAKPCDRILAACLPALRRGELVTIYINRCIPCFVGKFFPVGDKVEPGMDVVKDRLDMFHPFCLTQHRGCYPKELPPQKDSPVLLNRISLQPSPV